MRKFFRGAPPDFLHKHWQTWGERYATNRATNPGFVFQWPQIKRKKISTLLLPLLAKLTDGHCSYCDNFPLRSRESSIDHFRPKSKPEYYQEVCRWENLYMCCPNCQQHKLEQYNEFLLRPDDEHYSFDEYFIYSFTTNEILPNPAASELSQQKARTTIDVFGLNDQGHPTARRHNLERYQAKAGEGNLIETSDFPYRYTLLE